MTSSPSTLPVRSALPMAERHDPNAFVHMTAGGVSIVLDITDHRLPAVVHWGAALGDLDEDDVLALARTDLAPIVNNSVDIPVRVAVVPEAWTGWTGRPGVSGHREGRDWSPRFAATELLVAADTADVQVGHGGTSEHRTPPERVGGGTTPTLHRLGAGTVSVTAVDDEAQLTLSIVVEMLPSGLLRLRARIRNDGESSYSVEDVSLALPVPPRAREVLDFGGRWGKERTPQRTPLVTGIHEREGRKGRTGADAATVLSVGTPGFGFGHGEVWGVHTAWSGNHRHAAERLFNGIQTVSGGELLLPGEMRLGTAESYESPWVYAAYGRGLDDQARRFHDALRSRPTHPRSPRPVTINVWEAVYFDHDLARLTELADLASELGVERYVLDDGWFLGRRDDRRGLGDWVVDPDVWPIGLHPLIDHVHERGMAFGLWFEPEMVNEDSEVARAHPEWIMQTGNRLPVRARHQQVLDLAIPEAYDHVLGQMTALLSEYAITYIKWDHNRDLVDAGRMPGGRPAVHDQTLATYRLMQTLKDRFPGLEIESCSSGGGRVDLGILEHTDRIWVSDCIDPLERQQMNRWTMQLLPPELLGSHVASGVSHTTGRWHELSFRAGTALFGHFGIEWDLATASDIERRDLRDWIELYKTHRALMHTGDLVRIDDTDETMNAYGVVRRDRAEGLFFVATLGRSDVSPRGRLILPGLDDDRRYEVTPVLVGAPEPGVVPPAWWGEELRGQGARRFTGTTASGRTLASAGIQLPLMYPDRVLVLHVTAR